MNSPAKHSDFYNAERPALRFRKVAFKGMREPLRTNYFTIYRILSGRGEAAIDDSRLVFQSGALLFITPYQHVRFLAGGDAAMEVVEFHANFLCVETFHAEVGCAGRLFNDPYGLPIIQPGVEAESGIGDLFEQIDRELDEGELGYQEAALALLKLLLIRLTRLKDLKDLKDLADPPLTASSALKTPGHAHRHPTLIGLEQLIEGHYRNWHSPSDYAAALGVSAKTLGRLVREHLGITTMELIRRRILIHAKWQLLHTLKPVKEVATGLGFNDELYFSRLFKKATGVSPTYFRDFETRIRGGSNLSMTLGNPSMAKAPYAG